MFGELALEGVIISPRSIENCNEQTVCVWIGAYVEILLKALRGFSSLCKIIGLFSQIVSEAAGLTSIVIACYTGHDCKKSLG